MSASISTAADQFIKAITNLPTNQSMDGALERAIGAEEQLRALFASDPHNKLLDNLFLGLIDVFGVDPAIRRTRARIVTAKADLSRSHIFPVKAAYRRPNLMPSTVPDLETFRKHWDVFSHGSLSKMTADDWQNVVVAGGSVLACLAPPQPAIPAKDLNALYQSKNYATSDIDIFLWGLSPEQAKVKMENIYQAIRAASKWDVVCVRKARVISIHTNYPSRPIQIILRLYHSPAEILAGFDVDSACCAYDGQNVWVNPRALAAIIRQANTIDMSRRSPSYEIRLAKYAERDYEIYFPSLNRGEIQPSVYFRQLQAWPNGLARLLVLERAYYNPWFYGELKYPTARVIGKVNRPATLIEKFGPNDKPRSNTPAAMSSNYDSKLGHAKVPYGPHWDAKSISALIAKRDASMNSPHNTVSTHHRHVFFAGTMNECIQAFCSQCATRLNGNYNPDIHIRGPLSFMTVNPGRQLITGSFRPIDAGEWALEAYRVRE